MAVETFQRSNNNWAVDDRMKMLVASCKAPAQNSLAKRPSAATGLLEILAERCMQEVPLNGHRPVLAKLEDSGGGSEFSAELAVIGMQLLRNGPTKSMVQLTGSTPMNLEKIPEDGNRGCRCKILLVVMMRFRSLIDDKMLGIQNETRFEVPVLEAYCTEEKKS